MAGTALQVGQHITKHSESSYTLLDGSKGIHARTVQYVVTSTDAVGFTADAVRVVEESGRPPFAGDPAALSMAWFGYEAAVRRGDVRVI